MAAALQELGRGSITAVDLIDVNFQPTAEDQLKKAGLDAYATVTRMKSGYTWFLHDEIARHTKDDKCEEVYDLCIIDGPKELDDRRCGLLLCRQVVAQERLDDL
jgi:predicted O-methyltransferase YrrM